MLFKAGVAMRKANGTMPVSQVAAAAHATVRTLERKFKQSSGYTVKDVSGLMRFEQVRNHLWLYPTIPTLPAWRMSWAIRIRPTSAGNSNATAALRPAAFARKQRKEKQAVSNDFVAFIQA
jgi:methylphosphotriester-DNA--protein-cysteine methyltransferase